MPELYKLAVLDQEPQEKLLFLNVIQLEHFGLIWGQSLKLQIGFTSQEVRVAEQNIDLEQDTLYLSSAAFSSLMHYNGESLWLILSNDKILLGPTIGITVSYDTWRRIDKVYAITKRAFLALEKGLFFYCFHFSKLDPNTNLVQAYFLNPRNFNWEKKLLPLPQILYHRSTLPNGLGINPTIQRINTTYSFDKWNVYQALANNEKTHYFQPETKLLSQIALNQFLEKFRICYVKNIYGRGGKQVFRLEKSGEHFICTTGGNKVKRWEFTDLVTLHHFLRKKLGADLIVQEGISLARLDNRPFDIRVLVQKNINADWIISALSLRIANQNAVVTNCAAGAKEICLAPVDNLLDTGLSKELLENFVIKTLLALEKYYGPLGEVGLDIGLDAKGRIWLIEANSQPSSRGYKEAASEEICNDIFGLPLDYAKYLVRRSYTELEI